MHVAFSFDQNSENYKLAYAGPSYDDARAAVAATMGSPAEIGWILRNVQPSETIRPESTPTVAQIQEAQTQQYMNPPIYDLESAIGLSKLQDGRTVIAGDEERSLEMAPVPLLDISGQEIEAATEQMRSEHDEAAHSFTREGLQQRHQMETELKQAVEDQYAEAAGLQPRSVESDYTEGPHITKQRETEAQRAEEGRHAREGQINEARQRREQEAQQAQNQAS